MKYLILQHPGHNRVYYNVAGKLAVAELQIAAKRLSVVCRDIEIIDIEEIRYISLDVESIMPDDDIKIISRLSFVFAIYLLEETKGKTCLIPIRKANYEILDNKISSILKYQGKTNELFTRMMINVAMLSSEFSYSDNIRMLDPVSGKGTTLFEGTIYGFDVYGIEIESRFVNETAIFFKKYLEAERLKHTSSVRMISGANKSEAINIQEFEYALSKENFKSGESIRKLGLVCGSSKYAHKYFKGESFNLIVGDLPYGIAHSSSSVKKMTSSSRNPTNLLAESLPEWYLSLKPGGTVVLAWNSYLASRLKLAEIFSDSGFDVMKDPPYDAFEHMVDQSIKRDILVARKTSL